MIITATSYLLPPIIAYLIVVGLDRLISGEAHWFYYVGVFIFVALGRIFVSAFNPGYEKRIVEKYGTAGVRFAEKWRKGRN